LNISILKFRNFRKKILFENSNLKFAKMKKILTFLVLFGLLFSFHIVIASPVLQDLKKVEPIEKQDLKHKKKQKLSKDQSKNQLTEEQIKEKRKKEIEAKERSTDKNKPVKRISKDENLPETVRKRNIP